MNKRKVVTVVLMAVFVALCGIALVAQAPQMGRKGGRRMAMRDLPDDLDLTLEQQNKVIDLRFSHEQETLSLRRDLMKKRAEFKAELDKENPSQAMLDKISDEMTALQGKMKKSKIHFFLSLKSILTKEQWQKAKEALDERFEDGPPQAGMCRGIGDRRGQNRFADDPPPPPPPPTPDLEQ